MTKNYDSPKNIKKSTHSMKKRTALTKKAICKSSDVSYKLQKVLAEAGLGSRREMESWISSGRVMVDDKIAVLGQRVFTTSTIKVDNKPIDLSNHLNTRIIAYHKPIGEIVTAKDPENRLTVFSKIPKIFQKERWIAIGRLDINTSGLLLFTNNGNLANKLMHPSSQIEREYAVRVLGNVTTEKTRILFDGVKLDDGVARFTDIVDAGGSGANHWFHVCILEGKNREVRRLWESQGLTVSRLKRVRFGSYIMPSRLKRGLFEELTVEEVSSIMQLVGLTD